MNALETITNYYNCFNKKDYEGMLALVDNHIRHEPNEGEPRIGKDKFREFVLSLDLAYDEQLSEIVVMTEPNGRRAAAEFIVNGIYKQGDPGMPPATGQAYQLPAGAFLELSEDGLITRVTTHYNLQHWLKLVSQ